MIKWPKLLCLLAACSPAAPPNPEPPKLVAQRVTATVKREAPRLVHIRTEHAALVTTPEHPFATPEAGWVPAGRLVAGDQVVSARLGTLRVLSVQQEQRVEPRSVFNLTVAPSHTYVVGTDQVLVHNRKCKDPAEREREIEAAERELDEVKLKLLVAVGEDKPVLQRQLDQLKSQIAKLKIARSRQKSANAKRRKEAGAEPEPSGAEPEVALGPEASRSDALGRTVRALERLDREIEALATTSGDPSPRLAELKRERHKFSRYLAVYRLRDERRRGIARVPRRERALREAEAECESSRRALEAAQREFSALGEAPRSDAEKKAHAKRRAALEKELESLRFEYNTSQAILGGERRRHELAGRSPSTDAERQQLEAEQRALGDTVAKQRLARYKRAEYRKKRADPQAYEALREKRRSWARRARRAADYEADAGRPRDTLERLEAELAERRQGAGSEHPDERTEYLTEHITLLKTLTAHIRKRECQQSQLRRARKKRAQLSDGGRNTWAIEQKIARLVQMRDLENVGIVQLRLREKLLSRFDGMTVTDARSEIDEARLREFERELEGELAAGGQLGEERLREIQQELGESELIDAEFLASILRESGQEEAARAEAVQDESEDLDALLSALESSGELPSAERPAAVETGLQALQRELREERSAVEAADFALANEHAFWSQTLGRPGSSQHAAGAQRLAELQQQRLQLRIDWRARLQGRLGAARQELRAIQGIERLRDEAVEAELARKIALLEHEVNHPTF